MADIDFTNPLTTIVAFFGSIFSIMAVILKFGMVGGFFGIIIGTFTAMLLIFTGNGK